MAKNSKDKVESISCTTTMCSVLPAYQSQRGAHIRGKSWTGVRIFRGFGSLFPREDQQQIPNLERYIEEHPEQQAVVWAYVRKDYGEDPAEYHVTEGREHLAQRGYRL
jgi:hypothetical protein